MKNRHVASGESSGGGTQVNFVVEARIKPIAFSHSRVIQLKDGILSDNWREIEFEEGFNPAGVPSRAIGDGFVNFFDKGLPYHSAVALAYTLIAQHGVSFIECRIVAFQTQYEFTKKRLGLVPLEIKYDFAPDAGLVEYTQELDEGKED